MLRRARSLCVPAAAVVLAALPAFAQPTPTRGSPPSPATAQPAPPTAPAASSTAPPQATTAPAAQPPPAPAGTAPQPPPGAAQPYPYAQYPYPYPYYAPPVATSSPQYYPLPPPPVPPVQRVRHSTSMMYAGISMVLAGGLGVITGAIIAAEGSKRLLVHGPGGYLAGRSADEDVRDAGIAVAIITGAVFAAGVPLWSIGARQIVVKVPQTEPTTSPPPPKPAAILRLGPGGASFVASF